MSIDVIILGLGAGIGTWLFRFVPTKLDLGGKQSDGLLMRFFASTGPAAIATLFIASLLPDLLAAGEGLLPVLIGSVVTIVAYLLTRGVALATILGAVGYGLVYQTLLGWG